MAKFERPQPPVFEKVEDERLYRKQHLAAAFRLFGRFGFSEGIAGHITARDPEFTDHFWVNPLGKYFGHIRVSDLILVDSQGEVVKGDAPVNQAAFAIHSQIHEARPDIVAAAHAHSIYGKSWSSLGRLLDPLTQDACIFYQDHALFNDYQGVVLDTSEGKKIAETLGDKKAVILKNHGFVTAGTTVDAAAWWYISFERSAQAQLYANQRLIYSLAEDIDQNKYDIKVSLAAQTVKYLTTNNAIRVVEIGLQLIGNPGLSKKNPLERHYRDVLCSRIHTPQDDAVCLSLGKSALKIKT